MAIVEDAMKESGGSEPDLQTPNDKLMHWMGREVEGKNKQNKTPTTKTQNQTKQKTNKQNLKKTPHPQIK